MTARTVTLPVNPGASWEDFVWSPKYSGDVLDYTLDAADWLDDAGRVIESATASVSAGLTVLGSDFVLTGNAQTGVILQITDGTPLATEQVALALALDNGRVVNVLIALPIRSGLPTGLTPYVPPARSLSVGGEIITIGAVPITVPGTADISVSIGGASITLGGNTIVI